MGTSVSSSGPRSGVPLIPPWVSDPDSGSSPNTEKETVSPVAPPYRFRGTNLNMNRFAMSGSSDHMRKGLGQYVRKGLGGSLWASRRMARTATRAGALYDALDSLRGGGTSAVELGFDVESLAGRPSREILDRIVDALSPSDGTLGVEGSRNSILNALSRLIREEPTANLVSLSTEQINLAIEFFVGEEICRRIELDVGLTVLDKAPDVPTAIRRLDAINRYVQRTVTFSFRQMASRAGPLTRRTVTNLVSRVIQYVLRVFESYLS